MDRKPLSPATERFADFVGPEARARPRPNLPRALGGALAAIGGIGVVALGADVVVRGGSRALVGVFCAAYGLGGLALLYLGRPVQRTAGVVAVAVSIPAVTGFLVSEVGGLSGNDLTTVLAISTVAWGLLHVVGPGRGHGVALGLALFGAWGTVVTRIGIDAVVSLDPWRDYSAASLFGPAPNTSTTTWVSLGFGLAYLLVARWLDGEGLEGTASAFVAAGVSAAGLGAALAVSDQPAAVGGLIVLAVGALVAWVGQVAARRMAVWVGAAAVAAGLGWLTSAPFDHLGARSAAALTVAGLAVIALPSVAGLIERPEAGQTEATG